MQDTPDIPIGIGQAAAHNIEALQFFDSLRETEKERIASYVHSAPNGGDTAQRVAKAVDGLCHRSLDFLQ